MSVDNKKYYTNELKQAGENLNGDMKIKVTGATGESKWLNVNDQSIDCIIKFFAELKIIKGDDNG